MDMKAKRNYTWAGASGIALALIVCGCGPDDVPGPGPTPVAQKIEWTENGVQRSYTDINFEVDLTTTPNQFSLWVGQEGSDITTLGFSVPFAVGRYTIDASAEMEMGRPGCDVYLAGPNDGGNGWIEITNIEMAGVFPAVIRGLFEVTLVARGYCSPSSGPSRVCVGSFVASAYE
jgi:hypothetical protein